MWNKKFKAILTKTIRGEEIRRVVEIEAKTLQDAIALAKRFKKEKWDFNTKNITVIEDDISEEMKVEGERIHNMVMSSFLKGR